MRKNFVKTVLKIAHNEHISKEYFQNEKKN